MKIKIIKGKKKNLNIIIDLLNQYVSFGLANEENILPLIPNSKIVIIDNKIVGYASFIKEGNKYSLKHVVVLKNYRRMGIAQKLVRSILNVIRKNGSFKLEAYCWSSHNHPNTTGYLKEIGFNEINEYKDYWKDSCENKEYKCPYFTDKCVCTMKLLVFEE